MNSKPVRLLIELSAPKAQRSFRRIPLAPAPWNAALLPSFRRIPLGWLLNPAPQRLPVFTTKKLIELSVISVYYYKKSKETISASFLFSDLSCAMTSVQAVTLIFWSNLKLEKCRD
jgi:hypothetical protein